MADRVISAEAVISGRDATGDMFASLAKKMAGLSKGLPTSEKMNDLVRGLQRVEAAQKSIDKVQAARDRSSNARSQYERIASDVAAAKKAMEGVDNPTKKMIANLAAAESAAEKASVALRRQATEVQLAKRAAEGFGVQLDNLALHQDRLRASADSANKAIAHQARVEQHAARAHEAMEKARHRRAEGIAHHGITRFALGSAATYVGAHSVMRLGEFAVEKGAERQHVRVGAMNAGIGPDELARIEQSAMAARAGAPNMSTSQIIELHKEARSAVQHPEETFHLIGDLAKAASVLKGMGVQNANVADLVKGGESLGLMNDPHRFHTFLEGQVKAMAVMGKTIDTSQIYEAAKYSKSAGATLSDRFLNLVMPSLIQELHGSSAGEALAGMSKVLRGGLQHMHLPVEKLNEIGMLEEPSKIRRSKNGTIMGYAGKLVGDDLLASDPDKFSRIFEEHAEAHGYKTLADKIRLAQETLPRVAANLLRIFMQQRESIEQHGRNYEAAPGLDGMVSNQRGDPKAATGALRESLDDLASAVTGPSMFNVAHGISHLADGIRGLSNAAEAHPYISTGAGVGALGLSAAGAGYLAYQVSTGFGLTTAAGSLMGAAGALDAAAVKMGAESGLSGAGKAAGGILGGAATAGVAAGVAAAVLAGGAINGKMETPLVDEYGRVTGNWSGKDETSNPGAGRLEMPGWMRRLFGLNNPAAGAAPIALPEIDVSPDEAYGPTWFPKNAPMPPRRPSEFGGRPQFPGPMPGPLSGFSGPIEVHVPPVEANVHADVNARFQISAPPGFSVTETGRTTVIRAGSPSTGPSMPGAAGQASPEAP